MQYWCDVFHQWKNLFRLLEFFRAFNEAEHLSLNLDETKCMLIGSNRKLESKVALTVSSFDHCVNDVTCFKFFGILISSDFTWTNHVQYMAGKINQRTFTCTLNASCINNKHAEISACWLAQNTSVKPKQCRYIILSAKRCNWVLKVRIKLHGYH